jgi:hypothetical protein
MLTDRSLLVCAALTLCSCVETSPASQPFAGELMPPSLDGVALGMTYTEVRRARKEAFEDSDGLRESLGGRVSVNYHFADGPASGPGSALDGRLVAVARHTRVPSSHATVDSTFASLGAIWEAKLGPTSADRLDTVRLNTGGGLIARERTWHRGRALVVLQMRYPLDSTLPARGSVTEYVIDSSVEVDALIPLQFEGRGP